MYIVLMAGGVGTRFWPRSRRSYPKQLLNIIDSRSMLQLTFDRIKDYKIKSQENLYIEDRLMNFSTRIQDEYKG